LFAHPKSTLVVTAGSKSLLALCGIAHFLHVHGGGIGADHVLIGNTGSMLGAFIFYGRWIIAQCIGSACGIGAAVAAATDGYCQAKNYCYSFHAIELTSLLPEKG
jgi:hypothetical protein